MPSSWVSTQAARELGLLAHALSNDLGLALVTLELLQEQGAVPEPMRDWVAGAFAALTRATERVAALRELRDRAVVAPNGRYTLAS